MKSLQFLTTILLFLIITNLTAQVGINNSNPHESVALDITSTTGGLLIPRMTQTQRDAIIPAATGLMIYQTDGTVGFYYYNGSSWEGYYSKNEVDALIAALDARITALEPLAIGDNHQGGIVFYLDGNGGGLIAAPSNQSNAEWGCAGQFIGTSSAVGTGAANTTAIVSGCSDTPIAARICADLTLGGYDNWFLPSKDELNLMYSNIGQGSSLGNIGNFDYAFYWSSTESVNDTAWYRSFGSGNKNFIYKYLTFDVRAVRAF